MEWNNYKNKIPMQFDLVKILALVFLAFGFQQSHAQNTCATALPITAGTITVPGVDGVNIATTCTTEDLAEWYTYTPTQNYSVTITSDLPINICKETHFTVYTGTCDGLVCYAGDDDSGIIGCSPGNGSSYLSVDTFDVVAGTTYYIAWDDRWGGVAGFDFQLTEGPFIPSPCTTAIPVTAGTTTVAAIDGGNAITSCSTSALAKWYVYTPDDDYHLTITSDLPVNICKDTNFSVYTGSCSGVLTCVANDDNSGIIACDSGNTNSNLSKRIFDVNEGTTYYIAWDNKWSTEGFDFQIIEEEIIVPVEYNAQIIPTLVNGDYNECVADMNGDGKDDIASVRNANLRINFQGAGGTLTPTDFAVPGASKMPSWSIAAGDYNKDGYNDLLLGDYDGLSFWKSNATGTTYTSVTPGQYIFCQRTNFVDIDADGNLDAFSCHDVDPNVYYMNDGTGEMTYYQSGITPGAYNLGIIPSGGNYASLWTDLDNDGDVDMFVSKCSGPPCEIHRNDGTGFTDISAIAQINVAPVSSWSSAIADFDNDADMDIIIGSNGFVDTMFFRNNLDTSNETEEAYSNITAGSGWDTDPSTNRDYIAYDFDNDGFVDVLGGGNKIMFNQGDGTFLPTIYAGLNVGAVGDLNSDGFLDILNGTMVHYAVPNANKWITVTLQGIQSNRNGIGARVEIHGPWGIQIRDIRSGEGFGYMSTLNAHFGIGTATAIDKVVIKWPSGIVDEILNPESNESLFVLEGSSPLAVGEHNHSPFSIYPNPAGEFLNISVNDGASIKSAQIFDLNGKTVLFTDAITDQRINVQQLSTGTYIILLEDGNGRKSTQKFLKN